MSAIVGAASLRNVTTILLEGLKRLECHGYGSAGVAVENKRVREQGGNKSNLTTPSAVCPLQPPLTLLAL